MEEGAGQGGTGVLDQCGYMYTVCLCVRVCIRPEVSRTKTIGQKGVSNGQYFIKHLKFIYLNNNAVDFSKKNTSCLIKVSTCKRHVIQSHDSCIDVLQVLCKLYF